MNKTDSNQMWNILYSSIPIIFLNIYYDWKDDIANGWYNL